MDRSDAAAASWIFRRARARLPAGYSVERSRRRRSYRVDRPWARTDSRPSLVAKSISNASQVRDRADDLRDEVREACASTGGAYGLADAFFGPADISLAPLDVARRLALVWADEPPPPPPAFGDAPPPDPFVPDRGDALLELFGLVGVRAVTDRLVGSRRRRGLLTWIFHGDESRRRRDPDPNSAKSPTRCSTPDIHKEVGTNEVWFPPRSASQTSTARRSPTCSWRRRGTDPCRGPRRRPRKTSRRRRRRRRRLPLPRRGRRPRPRHGRPWRPGSRRSERRRRPWRGRRSGRPRRRLRGRRSARLRARQRGRPPAHPRAPRGRPLGRPSRRGRRRRRGR